MFEKVMELLERGVVALEQIAASTAQPSWVKEGCGCGPKAVPVSIEDVNYLEPAIGDEVIDPPHPSEVEMAQADAAYLEREFLKQELRRKGVKFKEAARTETLQKLLDQASMPNKVEEPPAPPVETPATTATKEEARNALVSLSAAKGKDAALAILKSIGGAEKLGDVPEDKYGQIVEACHGA